MFLKPLHVFMVKVMVSQIILTFGPKPECEKVEISFLNIYFSFIFIVDTLTDDPIPATLCPPSPSPCHRNYFASD